MKVFINTEFNDCVCISKEAENLYEEITGKKIEYGKFYELKRDDVNLIKVIEILKDRANGGRCKLRVCEIPDNWFYVVDNQFGYETLLYSESEIKKNTF